MKDLRSIQHEALTLCVAVMQSSENPELRACVTSSPDSFLARVIQSRVLAVADSDGIDIGLALRNHASDPFVFDLKPDRLIAYDKRTGGSVQYDIGDQESVEKAKTALIVSIAIEVIAILLALAMVFVPPVTDLVLEKMTEAIAENPGATRIILELAELILRKDWGSLLVRMGQVVKGGPFTTLVLLMFIHVPWWQQAMMLASFLTGIAALGASGPVALGWQIIQLGFMLGALVGKMNNLERLKRGESVIPEPSAGKSKAKKRRPFDPVVGGEFPVDPNRGPFGGPVGPGVAPKGGVVGGPGVERVEKKVTPGGPR